MERLKRGLMTLLACAFGAGLVALFAVDFEPPSPRADGPGDSARVEVLRCFGQAGSGAGDLALPRAAVVDPVHDRLYVVDKSSRILLFELGEGTPRYAGAIQLERVDRGFPTALDCDEEGRLWVADTHNSRVLVYGPDRNLVLRFGEEGYEPGKLGWVSGIAVGAEHVVLCDYRTDVVCRVQVFTRDGTWLRSFGSYGRAPGEFRRPVAVALTPEGDVLVASGLTHRVQKFTIEGDFLGEIGEAGRGVGQMMYPHDVECLPDGRFVVTEYGNNRVQLFAADGRSLRVFGSGGEEPGRFLGPWGTAIDARGLAYVVDYRNQRLQVLAGLFAAGAGTGPGWSHP